EALALVDRDRLDGLGEDLDLHELRLLLAELEVDPERDGAEPSAPAAVADERVGQLDVDPEVVRVERAAEAVDPVDLLELGPEAEDRLRLREVRDREPHPRDEEETEDEDARRVRGGAALHSPRARISGVIPSTRSPERTPWILNQPLLSSTARRTRSFEGCFVVVSKGSMSSTFTIVPSSRM